MLHILGSSNRSTRSVIEELEWGRREREGGRETEREREGQRERELVWS